jgi:hypothetical protein
MVELLVARDDIGTRGPTVFLIIYSSLVTIATRYGLDRLFSGGSS